MPPVEAPRRAFAVRIGAALGAAAILATTAACGQADPDLPGPETAAAPEAFTQENVDAWLDATLPDMLEDNKIAGATVAVVGDGQVVTTRGFGYADAAGVEVDPAQTLFRAGSVSKVFTATAVMQLVEQGELDLDADVSEYLDFELERGYDEDITLRNLLSHTAGFEERLTGLIAFDEKEVDLRAALAIDPPEQVYRPGTTPSYSNYGNSLAGYIVQQVSGVQFEQYIEDNIFKPLHLDSASFRQPLPEDLAERVSNGYIESDGPAQDFEYVGTPPAGSLSITADDMAQFMLAQLGTHPDGVELLTDATREEMFTPALTEETLGAFAEAQQLALGWFEEDQNGYRVVGHGGDTNYFHTHLNLYPDDGAGIFVSFNSSSADGATTLGLRSDLMAGFADRYFANETETAATVFDDATLEDAKQIEGTYYSSRGFHSTFLSAIDLFSTTEITALDDDRLYFAVDPGTAEPGVFEQVGDNLWREVDGERTIAVRIEDGQVTGIVHDAAFTLLPMETQRSLRLPFLIGGTAFLLIGLLAWPTAALYRKLRHRPGPGREGQLARTLVRVGAAVSLLALAGWVVLFLQILELQDPPAAAIRAVQILQFIGALGTIPAVFKLVGEIRRKSGWLPITVTVLTILAFSTVVNFAIEFQMLSPNISY